MRISVAIDGPAGAGKSTIAKILAKKMDLMYINTGAMYRAITLKATENNIHPENINGICDLLDSLNIYFHNDRIIVNGQDVDDEITHPSISSKVASYASINEVRQRLVKIQRDMSSQFDIIMDGRDIGTVVLKDADFKFYLTASADKRARRRYDELKAKNILMPYDIILNDIMKRDFDDTHRLIDPLTKAKDALVIDTTNLDIDEVVNRMHSIIMSN